MSSIVYNKLHLKSIYLDNWGPFIDEEIPFSTDENNPVTYFFGNNGSGNNREPIFTQDNLVIDFDKYEVTVDSERVDLTPTEFRLLSVLARYKGRVLPHEFLLTEVWGPEYVGEIDYLRLYVSYLRRKLEKDKSKPSLIHNEWGIGYRFG